MPDFRVGARDSVLSRIQTAGALERLREATGRTFGLRFFSSPGDRDRRTDLRQSPGDFFTADLDAALLRGDIDFAVHSAKDLPDTMPEGLDWFWLPWGEDPRDAVVARCEHPKRVGVSSARREAWVRRTWPDAECVTLRGNIPDRLAQLDAGAFDAILVAQAALVRLGLADRATRVLSLGELRVPPGQGRLAVTFRADDGRLRALRNLWLRAVRFIGAGTGDAELLTRAGERELRTAEVVLADALTDPLLRTLAPQAEWLETGKRSGVPGVGQEAIIALIGGYARRGCRVVRLKGGDPGLFGRLDEETAALTRDGIPFRVWPGVSALTAATTPTGLLLTLRGRSAGFSVLSPRATGDESNAVCFMALGVADRLRERFAPDTPCALVASAGSPACTVRRATVGALTSEVPADPTLLVVGPAALRGFDLTLGPLRGCRVWITGTPEPAERLRTAVLDFGGLPVVRPLVRTVPTASVKIRPSKAYSLLVVTSPSAARHLLAQMASPVQYLPKRLAVTGPGTAGIFEPFRIDTVLPESDFSAAGLLKALPEDLSGQKILRIRGEEAGPSLAEALRARGAKVKDLPIYRTEAVPDVVVPPHDLVFLASASAARVWAALPERPRVPVIAFGGPTAEALRALGTEPDFVARTQTAEAALREYACDLYAREFFHAP